MLTDSSSLTFQADPESVKKECSRFVFVKLERRQLSAHVSNISDIPSSLTFKNKNKEIQFFGLTKASFLLIK